MIKKIGILKNYINTTHGLELLEYCAKKHHSFENFAFMPITGGMNNQKGHQVLDRPDIHTNEILKYFNDENSNIFDNAKGNKKALEWYLSLFDKDIKKYVKKVYLIDNETFILENFLKFSNTVVCDNDTAIEYMNLAKTFWEKRNIK